MVEQKAFLRRQKFLALVCFATVFFLPVVAGADARCDSCKEKATAPCKSNCARVTDPNKKQPCLDACKQASCKVPCSFKISPASDQERRPALPDDAEKAIEEGKGGGKECADCMNKQRQGYCRTTCRDMNSQNVPRCVERCAKQQCAGNCLLPVNPKRSETAIPKMDCETCRRTMEIRCAEECGSDQEAAGYTSCRVSCVEDGCLESCKPFLFE